MTEPAPSTSQRGGSGADGVGGLAAARPRVAPGAA